MNAASAGTAGGEPGPTWDLWRQLMARAPWSRAGRDAGRWALDVLEARLGDGWPKACWKKQGRVPAELVASAMSPHALAALLELAARLHVVHADAVDGRASVTKILMSDGAHLHARLQLEVAALARHAGLRVGLERRRSKGDPPVDVVVRPAGSGLIPVETLSLTLDKGMREGRDRFESISARLLGLQVRHGVAIDVDLLAWATDDALENWINDVDRAASQVAADRVQRRVDRPGLQARVEAAPTSPPAGSIVGPTVTGKGWPRLLERLHGKAAIQARQSGARWLRVDALDGLWQLDDWASLSLADKALSAAVLVTETLAGTCVDGVVLSSGAAHDQSGQRVGESAGGGDTAFGLRRALGAGRVRETVIIALTAAGIDEAKLWRGLYDREPGWLRTVLPAAGVECPPEVAAG